MISITVTCGSCGDSEELEVHEQVYGHFDLPDGWIEDPEDDEEHLCEQCQIEQGLLPEGPEEWVDPNPPVPVMHTQTGFNGRCGCGALVWSKTTPVGPVVCSVCQHIKRQRPKLLDVGELPNCPKCGSNAYCKTGCPDCGAQGWGTLNDGT